MAHDRIETTMTYARVASFVIGGDMMSVQDKIGRLEKLPVKGHNLL